MKIAVLTSGGVDSSVALTLLKKSGHDVTAFYLKIWLEDELSFLGACPWEDDLRYARAVCAQLAVPLEIVSLQKEYWARVVGYTIDAVKQGLTPNPDMLCNQQIKFGVFYEKISAAYEKVATGHYAQTEERDALTALKRSTDPVKDQTYFLALLSQQQVRRALFPIGHLRKEDVRALARQYDLPTQSRGDSQGICFLGEIPFTKFIEHHLGIARGDVIEKETGMKLGEHDGSYFYTIGQRKGLELSGGPWYVVAKDSQRNVVYVSHGFAGEDHRRNAFGVAQINWISGVPPEKKELHVKIRHGEKTYACTLALRDTDRADVTLAEKDRGITPGQFAVFYDGAYCLGGGVIQ